MGGRNFHVIGRSDGKGNPGSTGSGKKGDRGNLLWFVKRYRAKKGEG